MTSVLIALDAMGGDKGPSIVVPAALNSLKTHPNLKLLLAGKRDAILQLLDKHGGKESDRLRIVQAEEVVGMDEQPSIALRTKKDSSMRVAINLVKQGEAQACVSAGNTGALMAMARFVLKTIPGIDRPAILALMPSMHKQYGIRVLDLGANVDSTPEQLFQFAVMGSVLSEAVDGVEKPRVALLNVGTEDIKGNEQVKKAAKLLEETPTINYIGYVEGNAIYQGDADVIVCDGFVGNIALKTSEGLAGLIGEYIKESFNKNWLTKLIGAIAYPVISQVRKRLDPARYNGASFIGLNGIVVKSHGGTSILGFEHAISEAVSEVTENVSQRIKVQVESILAQTYSYW